MQKRKEAKVKRKGNDNDHVKNDHVKYDQIKYDHVKYDHVKYTRSKNDCRAKMSYFVYFAL